MGSKVRLWATLGAVFIGLVTNLLYSSLRDQTVPYTLLSDPELHAAQAFHIAFHLDAQQYAEELKWGANAMADAGISRVRHVTPDESELL